MYNNDGEVMIFTVPNRDRNIVDKCDTNPHYVLCSVDKLNLVIYSCDNDGGVSTLLQYWVEFPKMLKEKNKKIHLMEEKKSYFRKYIQS